MQISVFANDGRFPVQFELAGLSQIYRFRQSDDLRGLEDITRLIAGEFTERVMEQFSVMITLRKEVLQHNTSNHLPPDEELPDII